MHSWGTAFAFDLRTGKEKVLYSFCSERDCVDGAVPYAGLLDVSGTLYSTTGFGGIFDSGTVFALKP